MAKDYIHPGITLKDYNAKSLALQPNASVIISINIIQLQAKKLNAGKKVVNVLIFTTYLFMALKISDAHANIHTNNMMLIKNHAKAVLVRGFNQIGHVHVV